MTCKDCIYDKKCIKRNDTKDKQQYIDWHNRKDCENCIDFKNKADFVEVVRCGDCEYWRKKVFDDIYERYVGECRCPQWENDYFWCETTETCFCSYGTPKERGGER